MNIINYIGEEEGFKQKQKHFFDKLIEERAYLDVHEYSEIEKMFLGPILGSLINFSKKMTPLSTVFDLGGGEGRSAHMITSSRKDIEVVIIDISKNSIKRALSKKEEKRIFFCLGDCENLPLKSNSCDYVILINLLHHMKDFILLDELKRCIKQDGSILIVDIVTNNPFREFAKMIWKYLPLKIKKKVAERDLVVHGNIPETHDFKLGKLRREIIKRFNIKSEYTYGAFAFIIFYILIIFPFMQRRFFMRILKCLNMLDNFLCERTFIRMFSTSVIYEINKK